MSDDEWSKASLVDLNKSEDWSISSNDCGYSYSTTLGNKLCGYKGVEGKVCSYANCPLKVSVERDEAYRQMWEATDKFWEDAEKGEFEGLDYWFDKLIELKRVWEKQTPINPNNTTKEEGE